MKKSYLISLMLLLVIGETATAQMRRVIRNYDGSPAHPGIAVHENNFINAVTSCTVDTILLTSQAQVNNFATTYPTCTTPKYLIIDGAGASPAITSLAGLSSITQVMNTLKITNTSLTNLSQMTALTQIGDTLQLERNNLLTGIGLNNLTALGSIYFKNLNALTSIAGLSNHITTMNNVRLDSTVALANISGLGNITHLNGNLEIGYTPLTSFSGINNCTYIEGWMWINNNDNVTSMGLTNLTHCGYFLLSDMPLLTTLAGLTTHITNTQTGTFWVINTGVTSLNGLEGLTGTSNFYINGNQDLSSISGLQNLSGDIGSGFSFFGNPLLTSLAPLAGITSVNDDGSIEIEYNGVTDLGGLQNIIHIHKGLRIIGNNSLTSLDKLNNNLIIENAADAYNNQKDSVEIYDNQQLNLCSDTSLCTYFANGGTAYINNNAAGCNSIAEIESTCNIVATDYNDPEDNCCTNNAITLNEGQIKSGHVGGLLGLDNDGDPYYDDYDTYKITLLHDGAFRLFSEAKNDSCFDNGSTMFFEADILDAYGNQFYNKTLLTFSDNICDQQKYDTSKFRGLTAGVYYIRLHGDNRISYRISYEAADSTAGDNEPNNTRATGLPIALNEIKKGHVRFHFPGFYDDKDFYRAVLPYAANIKVFVKTTYRGQQTGGFNEAYLICENTGNLFSLNTNGMAPDAVRYDTLKYCGLAADTVSFYLQGNNSPFEYELRYQITDSLPASGDTEPNGTFATATAINANQVLQQTLRTSSLAGTDYYDYFRTVLPRKGTVRVITQASNSNCNAGNATLWTYNRLKQAQGQKILGNNNNVAPGAVVIDTTYICGQAADTFYFRYESTTPFIYSFSYSITDTLLVDAEPNDSYVQAIPIAETEQKEGNVNQQTDTYDYYRLILPKDGTLKLTTEAYLGSCAGGLIRMAGFDRRQANGYVFEKYLPANSNGTAGQIIYDTTLICGRAADTFYIRFQGTYLTGNYRFKYEMIDTSANDIEPNNNFAQAQPIAFLQTKNGHIHYNANGGNDTYDYYKTLLPAEGVLKIMTQATNTNCANGQWLYLRVYDKLYNQLFAGYLANNTNVASGQTIFDTTLICGRAADSIYFSIEASNSFAYRLAYDMIDTADNDIETNNDFASATGINENQTKKGHVHYYGNGGADSYDYYRTVLPKDGTVKVYIKATNSSCANGQYMYMRFYDRRQANGEFFSKYVPGSANVSANETIYDTITLCSRAADTMYWRMEASAPFKYEVKYEMADTSANDAENNDSFAAALNITENQTKTGHIKYYSNGASDDLDYYRTVLPKDGTVNVYIKAKNSSCTNGQYMYMRFYDRRQGNGEFFSKYVPGSANVSANQIIYDTITLCSRAADTMYWRIEASNPFQYEVKYEMADTSANDAEPNNSFAQATGVGSNQTKKGHIKYISNGGTDDLDYYKFVFTETDSLKLQLQATNKSCANGQYIYLRLYDKDFNQIAGKYFPTNANTAINETVYDSIKILVTTPDTIYLRLEASNAFQYQFTTNPRSPSALFAIDGDTTVCYGTKTYKAINVVDNNVAYHWSLPNGGGTLSFTDSIATVNWNANGNRQIQLYLTNTFGSSGTITKNIIVNNSSPAATPVITNVNRNLFANNVPAGASCQWFKDAIIISGATDSIYYAADAGSFTAKFVNPCGAGAASNPIVFNAAALAQIISFSHTPNIIMSPAAKATLTATSSSGLPVNFVLVSGNASVLQDTVYAYSTGTIIVRAQQTGDNVYSPAAFKYDTITVVQGTQLLTFPPIADTVFTANPIALNASSSVGLPVYYTIVSGNAYISGNNVILTGAGTVTVQANQQGNADYAAAAGVQRSFCAGVRTLSPIQGQVSPCLNAYIYTAQPIPGANYVWTLTSGGTLTTHRDSAFITWTTQGTHTITVKANSICDPVYSAVVSYTISTANNAPEAVTNMLPLNNVVDQQLPLTLSWQPGLYSVNYDLYVWDSAQAQPAVPYAANIGTVNFTLPQNSFPYNRTYKWRIVSKNPCLYTAGPVQQFRLVPLPDLAVTQVQAPATAFSGQTISINWSVKNNGPGRTQTNQTWSDAVYLSFDSIPNFTIPSETNPAAWNQLQFPIRPLLIGTRPNVSALDSGQVYSNSLNFTLPVNFSQPLYVYVITNNPANANLPQTVYSNDTARAAQPIVVTLSPTPDLRVDTVFTPASVFTGNIVNVAYRVKNYGVVTPPNVSWYDKFYITPTAAFNPANAVQLFPAPAAGRYYDCNYNYYQGAQHTTQLNADSSYTNAVQLMVPNFILGTYFIHVVTNSTATVYEGALINNNTNSNQVQVYLTPTPVLDVATLSLQSNNVSTTQNVGVNWNINNSGSYDNREKNQGHYAKKGAFCANFIVGYTVPAHDPILAAGYSFTDSLGWGSSYWNDKIYLSRDSGNINSANLIFLNKYNHGIENNTAPCNDYNNTCLIDGNNDRNVFNIIRPTLNYPASLTVTIPDTLSEGNYYVYVLANADKTVFEYPAINRYKRSGLVTISRPDLTPPAVSVQPNTNAGVPVNVTYTVSNGGSGNVYNHLRRDKFYVSTAPVFTGAAIQIGTQVFTENVIAGSPVTHSFTYTFPPGTPTSTRYFYVVTNYDSAFKETTMANNMSAAAATNVTIAVAKDLFVSAVQLPANLTDTVFTLTNVPFKYTVVNNGADSIAGKTWMDSIFVSCTASFNRNTAFYLTRRSHSNALATGESYIDSFSINIPKFSYELNSCFGIDNTNAYFFVHTNADTGVYEGANTANDFTSSVQKKLINPYIDLTVTNVSGADTAVSARNYTASWMVKNNRYYTPYGYGGYTDGIYFSPDSVFNLNAISVAGKYDDRQLLSNQTSASTLTFILPNIPAGDYYVHVKTNRYDNLPAEKNLGNNTNLIRTGTGAAKLIHVNATPLPDITDSITVAPTLLAVGQSYNIQYQIKNAGAGVTYPGYMNTVVYLSPTTAPGGTALQQAAYSNPLPAGASYTDSVTINIPITTIPGNYVLVVNGDNNSNIIESNETNNTSYKFVTVYSPAPADLIVQNVSHPDSVYLGYTIDSLKWIVTNSSANPAQGISSDGLYLTASGSFDSTATLIGIKNKTIHMLPLASDTLQAQPVVNNVTEGNYRVFVKTDFLNNIVETNKDNNVGTPAGTIYVKVKELPLNVLTPNTLGSVPRYYKLIIPDSLAGATILVTLKSNDSLSSTNQMYIGKGYIPSAAHFDYQYDKPNYGNQDIVITSVSAGNFYITTSKITSTVAIQTISLKAVKLPFAILNVQSNSGGNTGNVTIKISGSLFSNNMVATLTRNSTIITASAVYYVNTTTVFATFNLAGKPLGIYDVTLTKPDTTMAVLANGFSIVPANNGGLITGGGINGTPGNGNDAGCDPNAPSGLNAQLVAEIVLPPKVFGGWPFVIQINYSNPTNVDIAAQARTLYCLDGFPIALTAAGLANAGSSIYLELSEPGGPPGIIRAGGSGTITLYSKAPVTFPAHQYGNYILR